MYGFNRFALCSPEGESGGGAPGGESSEDDSGETKDVVPKSQFLAALSNAEQKRERELAALRAEFEAKLEKATAKPADQPKRYSRPELLAAVSAGTIPQDQADAEWERQIREDARAEARQIATETVSRAQRMESVSTQISQYTEAVPELLDRGSDTYQKVAGEFRFLVAQGDDPKSLSTELKAIRAALGPVEKVRAARSGRASHEDHRETGGGGGGAGPRGGQGNLKLTERERAHYQRGIDNGLYKDWKAVETELKFKSGAKAA
jgi:hypothetical protein